jgi:hypothetical protein
MKISGTHCAFTRFNAGSDNGQTQAHSAGIPVPGWFRTEKRLKNLIQMFLRYAGPMISYADDYLIFPGFRHNGNRSAI